MNATSEDIKDILESEDSLELTYTDNLFIGIVPGGVDNCVTLIDTPGGSPRLTHNDNNRYFFESLQIQIRNTDYIEGMNLGKNIQETLDGRANEVWSSTYYTLIKCSSGPFKMGVDDNNRSIIIINFEIQRR